MLTNLFKKPKRVEPAFYEKNTEVVGVFLLSAGKERLSFLKYPERNYQVDGQFIDNYRLLVISETDDSVLADLDYHQGLTILASKVIKEDDESIIIQVSSEKELKDLFTSANMLSPSE